MKHVGKDHPHHNTNLLHGVSYLANTGPGSSGINAQGQQIAISRLAALSDGNQGLLHLWCKTKGNNTYSGDR